MFGSRRFEFNNGFNNGFNNYSSSYSATGPMTSAVRAFLFTTYAVLAIGIALFKYGATSEYQLIGSSFIGFLVSLACLWGATAFSRKDGSIDLKSLLLFCIGSYILGGTVFDHVESLSYFYVGLFDKAVNIALMVIAGFGSTVAFGSTALRRTIYGLGGLVGLVLTLYYLSGIAFFARTSSLEILASIVLSGVYLAVETEQLVARYLRGENRDPVTGACNLMIDSVRLILQVVEVLRQREDDERDRRSRRKGPTGASYFSTSGRPFAGFATR